MTIIDPREVGRQESMGPEPEPGHPTAGMHIWGWMTPVELEWLRAAAATMSSVVEVGSLHGRSAFALLTGCPGPVYCIDPWNDEHDRSFPSFMGSCGHFPNLVPVKGYSPAVAEQVPGMVDMVFIDGAHDRKSIQDDIDGWLPKTARLICGHDYYDTDEWKVKSVVDEMFGDRVEPAIEGDVDFERSAIWTVWLDR